MEIFSRHVSAGKVELYRELGLEVVMGPRDGAIFADAWSGDRWFNCHCNGGVFNLGHRHPVLVESLRSALDTLDLGNHHLVSGWRAELARRHGSAGYTRASRGRDRLSGGGQERRQRGRSSWWWMRVIGVPQSRYPP